MTRPILGLRADLTVCRGFVAALPNDPDLALFVIWRNAFAASHVALLANIRAFARMVEAESFAAPEDETQPLPVLRTA